MTTRSPPRRRRCCHAELDRIAGLERAIRAAQAEQFRCIDAARQLAAEVEGVTDASSSVDREFALRSFVAEVATTLVVHEATAGRLIADAAASDRRVHRTRSTRSAAGSDRDRARAVAARGRDHPARRARGASSRPRARARHRARRRRRSVAGSDGSASACIPSRRSPGINAPRGAARVPRARRGRHGLARACTSRPSAGSPSWPTSTRSPTRAPLPGRAWADPAMRDTPRSSLLAHSSILDVAADLLLGHGAADLESPLGVVTPRVYVTCRCSRCSGMPTSPPSSTATGRSTPQTARRLARARAVVPPDPHPPRDRRLPFLRPHLLPGARRPRRIPPGPRWRVPVPGLLSPSRGLRHRPHHRLGGRRRHPPRQPRAPLPQASPAEAQHRMADVPSPVG